MVTSGLMWIVATVVAVPCTITVMPTYVPDHLTYFVATATGDTVGLGRQGIPQIAVDMGHYNQIAGPVTGQYFLVDRIGGKGRELKGERVLDAVIVPWNFDGACQTVHWNWSGRWVDPGTRGFFLASLRRKDRWVRDTPTFDVLYASAFPMVSGGGLRGHELREYYEDTLKPSEYFELVQRLSSEPDRDAAFQELKRWAAENPTLAEKYPASRMLDNNGSNFF